MSGASRTVVTLVIAVLGIGWLAAACSEGSDDCTSRTVVNPDGTTTTEDDDCYRRSPYGSGGLGK